MPTLVLRNVPDDLYRRLKQAAVDHRRSMTQEAIVSLRVALEGPTPTPKPGVEETLNFLEREIASLPVLDRRPDDVILGYNADGQFD